MSDLEGKVVIITGVGRPRGVGRAAALRYAEKGAKLVLADLGSSDNAIGDIEGTTPDLNRVAAEVAAAGGDVIAVVTDVSKEADVKRLIEQAVDKYGRIDSMIANAAILAGKGDPLDISLETFMRIQEVNVAGVSVHANPFDKCARRATSSIVTVGSRPRAAVMPILPPTPSGFSVLGLTQSFAMAYAKDSIRIGVCPGPLTLKCTCVRRTISQDVKASISRRQRANGRCPPARSSDQRGRRG